jgi:hypothetical protein
MNNLPPEILTMIFNELHSEYHAIIARVCKYWWSLIKKRKISRNLLYLSARNGYVNILEWLNMKLGPYVCIYAANEGQIKVLKWAFEKDYSLNEWICYYLAAAAGNGQLATLQWLHNQGAPLAPGVCTSAAEGGYLDVIQWANDNGYPWNNHAYEYAASEGHLHVLKWFYDKGCRFSRATREYAIAKNRHHILRWLDQIDL